MSGVNVVKSRIIAKLILSFLIATSSTGAYALVAELVNYVSQYQVGVDYSNAIDKVQLSYNMTATGGVPDSCQIVDGDPTRKQCTVGMVGGASNGWGVFLQRAFKKQGLFYFNPDVSFGARFLSGELPAKERSLDGLPLNNASFSLGAVVMKPYVQFGVTPDSWPDVLLSMGPAIQMAIGKMTINDQSENVAVGTSSVSGPMSVIHGFFALEVVLKRFGDGAFSLIASHDVTGNGRGTKIFPHDVDGMSDFHGSFSRNVDGMAYGFGLKLVTPWP